MKTKSDWEKEFDDYFHYALESDHEYYDGTMKEVKRWICQALQQAKQEGIEVGYDQAIDEFLSLIKTYSEYGKYKIKDLMTEMEVIPIDTLKSKISELKKKDLTFKEKCKKYHFGGRK